MKNNKKNIVASTIRETRTSQQGMAAPQSPAVWIPRLGISAASLVFAGAVFAPQALAAVTQKQIAAAEATAAGKSCSSSESFYWEVGDMTGVSVSGTRGMLAKGGDKPVRLASASKLLFATYVLQYRKGFANLSTDDIRHLNMRDGYESNHCVDGKTVMGCFQEFKNSEQTPANLEKFYYSGAQMQALAAIDLDGELTNSTNDDLAATISAALGMPANTLTFSTPTVGDGMMLSPAAYGAVLRQILSGNLQMNKALGRSAVCTSTAKNASGEPICPSSAYSPPVGNGQIWQYSLGHWVEKDPNSTAGDGAFSSPGEYGFYPWIDASKKYYGIVSRADTVARTAYQDAIVCGGAIRNAFITGVAE